MSPAVSQCANNVWIRQIVANRLSNPVIWCELEHVADKNRNVFPDRHWHADVLRRRRLDEECGVSSNPTTNIPLKLRLPSFALQFRRASVPLHIIIIFFTNIFFFFLTQNNFLIARNNLYAKRERGPKFYTSWLLLFFEVWWKYLESLKHTSKMHQNWSLLYKFVKWLCKTQISILPLLSPIKSGADTKGKMRNFGLD